MLTIIESGLSGAAHEEMKREIYKMIENGERSYLIVPEQQTVIAESEMTEDFPDYAPLYFEVTNFTRLADAVFRTLGGVAKRHADKTRKNLVMWKTLAHLSSALDMTRSLGEINEGVVSRALSATEELDRRGIDTEELLAVLDGGKIGGRLKKKISDVAMIHALYKKNLGEKYQDTEMGLMTLREKLDSHPEHLRAFTVYLEGFTSFTAGQYALLSRLMLRCDLRVILPLPRGREELFEFGEILGAKKKLLATAVRVGAERKLVRLGDYDPKKPLILTEAERILWRNSEKFDNDSLQKTENLRIFEAYTPFEECDFVAADIRRRVIEGASYSDFAIIAKDPRSYFGILDTSLLGAGIPHFLSIRRELTEFEAIKLILSSYACIIGKYRREDVISFMKCGFLDIPKGAQDSFELYAQRWQLSGKAISSPDLWNMNPDGYTTRRSENAALVLKEVNEVKKKLLTPLLSLDAKTREAMSVTEHASALYDFLLAVGVRETVYKRYGKDGEAIWKVICDALDILTEVFEDEVVSREVFLSELKVVFSASEIGKIPSFVDEVTVGGADMLRLHGKRHVYLLGVNAGEFPGVPKDDSYFSEREGRELAEAGIDLEPELEAKCARELFTFTRAMSFAAESVTMLYTQVGTDFKARVPAEPITKIVSASDGKISPVKISELPAIDSIYTTADIESRRGSYGKNTERAIEEALLAIGASKTKLDGGIENANLTLCRESTESLYGEDMALTQSRIDSFVSCPLSYFLRYNLKLDDGEVYLMDYSGAGSFVHAVLENFFGRVESEKIDLKTLDAGTRAELTMDAAKKYLGELLGGAQMSTDAKVSLKRLYRATLPIIDDLCEELSESQYKPKFFELNIRGGEDTPEPAVFCDELGGRVKIYGQIDRVDAFSYGDDVYVRVIDYKTGQKSFSPKDLEEAKNLQMFLYLKSITESKNAKFRDRIGLGDKGRLIPAGVVYVKTALTDVKVSHDDRDEIKAEIRSKLGREGMILDDAVSISAANPAYLPVKFKKDGTPYASSEKYLYSTEGWDALMDTVRDSVIRVSRGMRGGELRAVPRVNGKGTPCEWCEYKPICRKATYK